MMLLRRASLKLVSFYPEFVRSRDLGVNQRINVARRTAERLCAYT